MKACLNSVLHCAEQADRTDGEIIVVDDCSNDGSIDILKSYGNLIKLVILEANRGFSNACNTGFRTASGDIVILLNNDVHCHPGLISAALKHFNDELLFAVSFRATDETGSMRAGRYLPVFKKGFLKGNPDDSQFADTQVSPTLFAAGGGTAFHRSKFLLLGGFDERMNPFYWEDADISYRAWKRGWSIIYDPECHIIHPMHGVIHNSFSNRIIYRISCRNQIIFNWKNIDSPLFLASNLFFILFKLIGSLLQFKTDYPAAVRDAIRELPHIVIFRRLESSHRLKKDIEIFSIFSKKSTG